MSYLNFVSEYDKYPKTKVEGFKAYQDYEEILPVLKKDFINKRVVVFEMYPGVNYEEVLHNLMEKLNFNHIIKIDDYSKTEDEINKILEKNLTNDRVFGIMSHFKINEFYDESYLEKLNKLIFEDRKNETFLVYGFGASLIKSYDELVYFDMARWEIQLRYRNGMSNWKTFNQKEDNLKKFKRGYFIEWRVADRLKKEVLKKSKYYIDTVKKNNPKMIETIALFKGLNKVSRSPFRLVPYFDPGVWGGQWMKEVCDLDKSKQNYAWSFDGVPEENSIYLDFNGVIVETPSINVVFFEPINLLGNKVHGRYGTEYPIRFDFLDTMDGGNLSLQVHPLTEYIQDTFGMHYTQDESYYILDAGSDAVVYLGVKENINKEEFIEALKDANKGNSIFDDSKYINKFKVKKHDHILIPAGTIHCSGRNSMVLEISSTPYIFTFKLWDWGRVGLDGLPRPVHIEHGEKVIQYDRDTNWVKENLINKFVEMEDGSTKTGLHEREPIETRRYFFNKRVKLETSSSCNSCNLVEGKAAIIEPVNNEFEPLIVHYAETFIIPESVKEYYIRPLNEGEMCGVLKAYVR